MKRKQCRWCPSPATHRLNGQSYCCAHFDEAIAHGVDLPGDFGELIRLAEIGRDLLLKRPAKREAT